MVMMASWMPLTQSAVLGSGVRVALGNATPLTTTVVGSMSVTGSNEGVVEVVPKT